MWLDLREVEHGFTIPSQVGHSGKIQKTDLVALATTAPAS